MKSQATLEFTLLFVFLAGVFLLVFIILGQRMVDLNREKELETVENIQERISGEVELAISVENGYIRRFQIPRVIYGVEYNMTVDPTGWLVIILNNRTYQKKLPQPMVGGFCFKDTDLNFINLTVRKEADLVSLSSCFDCSYSYAVCLNAEHNGWCDWLSGPGLFPGFNETCCNDHCLCCP